MAIKGVGVLPHRIELKETGNLRMDVLVDGNSIKGVKSIYYHATFDELPHMTISLFGNPNIETKAFVDFSFTPTTVDAAFAVLKSALINDSEHYWEFCELIESALQDYDGTNKRAEHIANRIIGRE